MDYDQTDIAASYDKARALVPETARLWRELLLPYIDRQTMSLLIDLGCGTGRFTDLLAFFGVRVIGIDPSIKMIEQARRKPAKGDVTFRQGSAEALPLTDGFADLVFMSMIYHHLTDPSAVARECHRVLCSGGFACIRNGIRETDFPHRQFFPSLEAMVAAELPSQNDVMRVFLAAGFNEVTHRVVTQVVAPDWHHFVEKSALRADSFLARLSDREFEEGMAALRCPGAAIEQNDPVTEEIGWFVFARSG